jgi:hypothetical protein
VLLLSALPCDETDVATPSTEPTLHVRRVGTARAQSRAHGFPLFGHLAAHTLGEPTAHVFAPRDRKITATRQRQTLLHNHSTFQPYLS